MPTDFRGVSQEVIAHNRRDDSSDTNLQVPRVWQ
jgi:hypothetical protein